MFKKTVSAMMLFLLVASMFAVAFKIQQASADVDWWTMFHHDLNHTGTSTSTGPTTNNTLWTYTTGGGIYSSPAVVGGLVYVGSDDGNVYCLNAATGALVWSYKTGDQVWSSPAVVGGFVYVGSVDNKTYCLNAATGLRVWNYTTGNWVFSDPAVVGGLVYVGSDDRNVYCLNATTGTQVWNYTTNDFFTASSPAVVGGFVYVGSNDGNVYCLNAANGSLAWRYTTGGEVWSPPAVVGGFVYVGSQDAHVYCLNAATGSLVWSYRNATFGGSMNTSPAVVGGFVYVGSLDNNTYCLKAATGAFVWSYATGAAVESSPAVAGGKVYVGSDDGNVYCLDPSTGAKLWSYKTSNYVFSSPAVVNGVVYVGSVDGKIYAIGPSSNPQTYSVAFTESGLVQNTQWSVTFNGQTQSSTSDSIVFNVTSGVYAFSIIPPTGYTAAPSQTSGSVTVNGAGTTESIMFIPVYTVTFTESGLDTGAEWSVTFNGMTIGGPSNVITFYGVENGMYSFTVCNITGNVASPAEESVAVASPSSGTISVNGANVNQGITFQYTVASWDPSKDSYDVPNFAFSSWTPGGDCYGLSATAVLYFSHYKLSDSTCPYFPSQPDQANSTSDLNLPVTEQGVQVPTLTTLNNASLAVLFNQLYGAPWNNRLIPPPSSTFPNEREQYDDLVGNLTKGQPVVLILGETQNQNDWPHAVVAWGAGTIGNGNYAGDVAIYLYDPNFPQKTTEAIINPVNYDFSYDTINPPNYYANLGYNFSKFYIMDPATMAEFWAEEYGQTTPFVREYADLWFANAVSFSLPGYNVILANKMVTVDSNGLKDYFTDEKNSQTFVEDIPGSFGIEQMNTQVYALTQDQFTVDPNSNESTILITRVDNESGQLVAHGYLFIATTTQGAVNFTITPSSSGLSVFAGDNGLNASVTYFSATQQGCSVSDVWTAQINAGQNVNFTAPCLASLTASKNVVGKGYPILVNVTITNIGINPENVSLTLYANSTTLDSETIFNLLNGSSTTLSCVGNTSSYAYGNYTLSTYTCPLPNETDTAGNNYTCSISVHIGVPGDVSSATPGVYDGITNMRDIAYLVRLFNTRPTSPNWNPNADINNDGVCNMRDIAIAIQHFNQHE